MVVGKAGYMVYCCVCVGPPRSPLRSVVCLVFVFNEFSSEVNILRIPFSNSQAQRILDS